MNFHTALLRHRPTRCYAIYAQFNSTRLQTLFNLRGSLLYQVFVLRPFHQCLLCCPILICKRISCLAHVKWTGDENLTSHKKHIRIFSSSLFWAAFEASFVCVRNFLAFNQQTSFIITVYDVTLCRIALINQQLNLEQTKKIRFNSQLN